MVRCGEYSWWNQLTHLGSDDVAMSGTKHDCHKQNKTGAIAKDDQTHCNDEMVDWLKESDVNSVQ